MNSHSTVSDELQALSVSSRDVQFLVALNMMYVTYLSVMAGTATPEQLEWNENAVDQLLMTHYSGSEVDALNARLRALLPQGGPLLFVQPTLMHSALPVQ